MSETLPTSETPKRAASPSAGQSAIGQTRCPRWLPGLATALLIVAIFLAGRFASTATAWMIIAASMIVFVAVLGGCVSGRILGILITERNVVSLSRLQVVVWTIIVLSAFVTIALKRVFYAATPPIADPLAIMLPWQLWALMGISTASLIGSPLVTANKETNQRRLAARRNAGVPYKSTRIARAEAGDAEFADMFRGDKDENSGSIDVAKVQMFLFTIICALAYSVVLGNWMVGNMPDQLSRFPVLADGLIALLGISHAGYLSSKGIPDPEPQ